MNKSTLSFSLQQKNCTSNLFQLQSQIKFNELTNSQQLSPQIQTLMFKISKSTIASMQKVPSSLLWQMPFRRKLFGLQRDILTKLRRPKHLENSANNCKMSTNYFSVQFQLILFSAMKHQPSKCTAEKWKITGCPERLWSLPLYLRYSKAILGNLLQVAPPGVRQDDLLRSLPASIIL